MTTNADFQVPAAKISLYLERRIEELRQVEAAIGARRTNELAAIMHRIKGNAALFGLPDLGLVAARIEELAEQDVPDWDGIRREADELATGLREAFAGLAK